jgi:hypothetical protein
MVYSTRKQWIDDFKPNDDEYYYKIRVTDTPRTWLVWYYAIGSCRIIVTTSDLMDMFQTVQNE